MSDKQGAKIVLTASATEMSDYYNNPFYAFAAGFSNGIIPLWFLRKQLYPPVEKKNDGTAKYAPYGLRKVEAVLLENGFDESEIATVHPIDLDKFIGPDTKVVGISTMDPLGLGYVSKTYSSLVGSGESIISIEFRNIMKKRNLQKYKPKNIVGGAGAWQLEDKGIRDALGIDCVVIGEGEKIVSDLFVKAMKGEKLPPVIHVESSTEIKDIPTIKHASIHGFVEISRGCGRNCQFCTPTMKKRRTFPLDKIMSEVEVNISEGAEMISLSTEDIFLYGSKENSFIPDKKAVLNLVRKISSYPQVKAIQPAHMSLPPVVYDSSMVKELSEMLIEHSCFRYYGKPIVTAETGIETGSPRLIQKYMAGKTLPFEPKEWKEIVCQGIGILNDNYWYPLATLIVGLPDENEDDIVKTIELIDDLNKYKAFLVPLLFVPLENCILRHHQGANLDSISKKQWEFLTKCWEYNARVWGPSFLKHRFNNRSAYIFVTKFFLPSIGFILGPYYGKKHGKIMKDFIGNMIKGFQR